MNIKENNNEHVASYYYDSNDAGEQVFDIYVCYDNVRDVQFYNVYNKSGDCINEEDPFYDFPSWNEIYDNYLQKV